VRGEVDHVQNKATAGQRAVPWTYKEWSSHEREEGPDDCHLDDTSHEAKTDSSVLGTTSAVSRRFRTKSSHGPRVSST
jgi:hypothetical protein